MKKGYRFNSTIANYSGLNKQYVADFALPGQQFATSALQKGAQWLGQGAEALGTGITSKIGQAGEGLAAQGQKVIANGAGKQTLRDRFGNLVQGAGNAIQGAATNPGLNNKLLGGAAVGAGGLAVGGAGLAGYNAVNGMRQPQAYQ